jgi:hypothetical protein
MMGKRKNIGIRQPVMINRFETGTIVILARIKYVGNLLKSIIVSGRVPAWATIVTAADCQILSINQFLKDISWYIPL